MKEKKVYCKSVKKEVIKEYRCPEWDCETCPEIPSVKQSIPSDSLKNILTIYKTLQDTSKLNAKDYERIIEEFNKPMDAFHRLREKRLISDAFADFMIEALGEITNAKLVELSNENNADYHLLSMMETVFYNPKTKTFQQKTKGNVKNVAFDFLLLALVTEMIQRTGKPNYNAIIEYLKTIGINDTFNNGYLTKRYERTRKVSPLIKEILEVHFFHTSKNLSLLKCATSIMTSDQNSF